MARRRGTPIFEKAKPRKGLAYTTRQFSILRDDIPLSQISLTELFNIMKKADERGDSYNYEDASLSYTGIDKNADKAVGGWDTVLRREEYEKLFYNQQETMKGSELPPVKESLPFTSESDEPLSHKSQPTAKVVLDVKTEDKPKETKAPILATPTKPQKVNVPEVSVWMIAMHKKFGKGTISNIDKAGKHLRVTFAESGEKAFIYPDAFVQGFLTLEKGE